MFVVVVKVVVTTVVVTTVVMVERICSTTLAPHPANICMDVGIHFTLINLNLSCQCFIVYQERMTLKWKVPKYTVSLFSSSGIGLHMFGYMFFL